MPILVRCDGCGHEITVSDSMQGKRGRCPKCDGVVAIPKKGKKRGARGASRGPAPSYGALGEFATFLNLFALVGLLALSFIGVYTGITAIVHGPEGFHGPLNTFSEYVDRETGHPTVVGIGFIVGGVVLGAIHFLFVSAAAQVLRLFISVERSLLDISEHFARRD